MNIEETINTIKFSEIAQKGYKIMSNDEFDSIVNGVLQLQTENQQLKGRIDKAIKYMDDTFNISSMKEFIEILNKIEEILDGSDVGE